MRRRSVLEQGPHLSHLIERSTLQVFKHASAMVDIVLDLLGKRLDGLDDLGLRKVFAILAGNADQQTIDPGILAGKKQEFIGNGEAAQNAQSLLARREKAYAQGN